MNDSDNGRAKILRMLMAELRRYQEVAKDCRR
jgi:hypothetical protein